MGLIRGLHESLRVKTLGTVPGTRPAPANSRGTEPSSPGRRGPERISRGAPETSTRCQCSASGPCPPARERPARRPPRSRRGASGTTRGQTTGPPRPSSPSSRVFPRNHFPAPPGPPRPARRRALRASLTRRLPPSVGTHARRTGAWTEPECAGRAEAGRIKGKPLRGPAVPVLTERPGVTVTVDTLPSGRWSFLRGVHGQPMPIGRPD